MERHVLLSYASFANWKDRTKLYKNFFIKTAQELVRTNQ